MSVFPLPANWTDCSSVFDCASRGNGDTRNLPGMLLLHLFFFFLQCVSPQAVSSSSRPPAGFANWGEGKKIGKSDESKWHDRFDETPTLFFSFLLSALEK